MTLNRPVRSSRAAAALALSVWLAGCGSDAVVDPVFVCRCAPDEICINETCVPVGDVRIVDAPDPDAVGCEPSDAVRISEARHAGVSRPDFVELAGPPGTSVEGWYLRSHEADGSVRATVQVTGALGADGLWVAAFGPGLETTPDIDYGGLGVVGLASPSGTVVLFDCEGAPVDALGYGTFGADDTFLGEGSPAPATGDDQSLARCLDAEGVGIDTDDNAVDFTLAGSPSPGTPNTDTCTPCDPTAFDGEVWIAEVLYDPAGADADTAAFVELGGSADLDLAGVTLELWDESSGTFSSVASLAGAVSSEGRFLVGEDGLADADQIADVDADNDAGGFRLVACGGVPLDVVGWGALADPQALGLDSASPDVPDGSALGRCPDDASGAFTELTTPTPGAANSCP